jgi:Flp pilus assembly protein TadD
MLDISAPAGSVHAVALPEAVVVESPVAPVVMAVDALPVPDAAPLRDAVPVAAALPIRGPVPKVVAMVKPVLANNESRPAPVPELALGPVAPSSVLAVLAQAQSLWRSGSQEAALELLSQAVASAERDAAGLSSVAHNDRLVLLVRELVRQQLAMGQVGPAMEVMVRLAPALSGSAETWALRGHAAQRLGQHQSSADAYVMALKIRPNEPRWMLGAAVSLASLGQLQDAADMADKARTAGWVSPDVLAYLSQLGVTLREP